MYLEASNNRTGECLHVVLQIGVCIATKINNNKDKIGLRHINYVVWVYSNVIYECAIYRTYKPLMCCYWRQSELFL